MNFKVNTQRMNAVLSKVSKGVGNSKILPLTGYLKIVAAEGNLHITATNSVNFIRYTMDKVECVDGMAIVQADPLIKLVSKTTTENMTFKVVKDENTAYMSVTGNGTYKIPMLDDTVYMEYSFPPNVEGITIAGEKLKNVFAVNKSAIATQMLQPSLTGYNLGKMCVTTDGVKMCLYDQQVFDKPTLITQALADLIQVLPDSDVLIQRDGNKLLFTTDRLEIFGTELDGIETYPDVSVLLDFEYGNAVSINRTELLDTLDRLAIFASGADLPILLDFRENTLYVAESKGVSGEEVKIDGEHQPYTLYVSLGYLESLVGVLPSEVVKFSYQDGLPLRIDDDKIALFLSALSTEE